MTLTKAFQKQIELNQNDNLPQAPHGIYTP